MRELVHVKSRLVLAKVNIIVYGRPLNAKEILPEFLKIWITLLN